MTAVSPSRAATGPAAAVPASIHDVPIQFDEADSALLARAASGRAADLRAFELCRRAAQLAAQPGFDRLICLPMLREMEVLEHQVLAARTALRRMRGRALLCDEVGLGKTIEAGLVLAELISRGLARSVLILVPPTLLEQWQAEMRRKFSIELIAHDDPAFHAGSAPAPGMADTGGPSDGWTRHDRVLASLHTAKRSPHRESILARSWDIVIVDEAHHLRNRTTQAWKFVSQINKRFMLLLTATPVQNNLEELFNLVTLLEPGLLSTAKRFTSRFVDKADKLTPRNVEKLHELLAEVMVRNRRHSVGMQFTRRWARTDRVTPSNAERSLYHTVSRHVQEALRPAPSDQEKRPKGGLSRMIMCTLQMELGSSAQAVAGTLTNLAAQPRLAAEHRRCFAELAEQAGAVTDNSKADRLLQLLADWPDKLVVFTQYRATQQMLFDRLGQAGIDTALFHGGLSRLAKEQQVQRFRGDARVLLTTDSGSEGRNLQFCHGICNFDLPWNPMRIEQRIGRLSRIGQRHDVHVFNLVAEGTVEAAILHLLEAKLAMFELVIGEIDMVLGNLDEERDFADVVADLWGQSNDVNDFGQRMEQLGDRLLAAKQAYFEQRAVDDRIFGDRFKPE